MRSLVYLIALAVDLAAGVEDACVTTPVTLGKGPSWTSDPLSVFLDIEIRINYELWNLSTMEEVYKGANGGYFTTFETGCPGTNCRYPILQLGRTSQDARTYYPTMLHLRPPVYHLVVPSYQEGHNVEVTAELVVVHELDKASSPMLKTRFLDEDIDFVHLVIPLTQRSYRKKLDDWLDTAWNSKVTHKACDLFVKAAPTLQHSISHPIAIVVPGQLPACNKTLAAVMMEGSNVFWLPESVKQQKQHLQAHSANDAPVTMLPGSLRTNVFPWIGNVHSQKKLLARRALFGYPLICLYIFMFPVSIGVAMWKAHHAETGHHDFLARYLAVSDNSETDEEEGSESSSERPDSRTLAYRSRSKPPLELVEDPAGKGAIAKSSGQPLLKTDSDDSDDKPASGFFALFTSRSSRRKLEKMHTQSSMPTQDKAVDGKKAVLMVLFAHDLSVCVRFLFPEMGALRNPSVVSCQQHAPWEKHIPIFFAFLLIRIIDLWLFSGLPLKKNDVHVFTPFPRSVCMRVVTSSICFGNVWYDEVAITVVRACQSTLWHPMKFIFLFFLAVWLFILPVLCLLYQPTTKPLLKLANMDITASYISFGSTDGHMEPMWMRIHYVRAMYNAPMALMQLAFICGQGFDSFLCIAFCFSVASLIFSILCVMYPIQWWGTLEELKEIDSRTTMKQLRDAVQQENIKDVKRLLDKSYDMFPCDDQHMLEAQKLFKVDLTATPVDADSLKEKIRDHLEDRSTETGKRFRETVEKCFDALIAGHGGMIVAVLHRESTGSGGGKLRTAPLDGEALLGVFQAVAPNVHEGTLFADILGPLCRHNESDRWEKEDIRLLKEALQKNQKQAEGHLTEALKNQPKDGAIVVDEDGDIVSAAVKLGNQQELWDLKKMSEETKELVSSGTRHAGALATAVWLSNQERPGIVFVRSDAGGVLCLFGEGKLVRPEVLLVKQTNLDSANHA